MAPDQGNQNSSPSQGVPSNGEPQSHAFEDYAEYLGALVEYYPDAAYLLAFMGDLDGSNGWRETFNRQVPQLSRVVNGSYVYHEPGSFSALGDYLNHPEDLLQYQIIFINMYNPRHYHYSRYLKTLIDELGLRLDIPPPIWSQLLLRNSDGFSGADFPTYLSTYLANPTAPCKFKSDFLIVGRHLLYIRGPSDQSHFSTGM